MHGFVIKHLICWQKSSSLEDAKQLISSLPLMQLIHWNQSDWNKFLTFFFYFKLTFYEIELYFK